MVFVWWFYLKLSIKNCGSRIWTCDLRVMSPTSFQTAPSRDKCYLLKRRMGRGGFEPPKQVAADLQSVPFGHSGIYPDAMKIFYMYFRLTVKKYIISSNHTQDFFLLVLDFLLQFSFVSKFSISPYLLLYLCHYGIIYNVVAPNLATERGALLEFDNFFLGFRYGKCS